MEHPTLPTLGQTCRFESRLNLQSSGSASAALRTAAGTDDGECGAGFILGELGFWSAAAGAVRTIR